MSSRSRVGVRLVRIASVYLLLPRCAGTRLAVLHFWLHNLGLPVMVGALAAETLGVRGAAPYIGLGSTAVVVGLGLFTLNVLRNAADVDFVRG